MSIKSVMNQIKEKTIVANDDLKDATNNTRPMREGFKRQAKESLEDLQNEYRNLLIQSSSFLIVTGSLGKELCDLAANEPGVFVGNPEDFFTDLVSRIDSRAFMNRTADGTTFEALGYGLELVAREIGVKSYPQLRFKAEYAQTLSSPEDMVKLAQKAVSDSVGNEMSALYSLNGVLKTALNRGHEESFTPILLNTSDEQFALALLKDLNNLTAQSYLVVAGKGGKAVRNARNSVSLKEATTEALQQLLDSVKGKV